MPLKRFADYCGEFKNNIVHCLRILQGMEPELKQINEFHRTTNSSLFREFAWKITVRCFLTPELISKYRRNSNSQSWRNCGKTNENYLNTSNSCN